MDYTDDTGRQVDFLFLYIKLHKIQKSIDPSEKINIGHNI